MSSQPVRVRIAPSPTGDAHVGTAYQALFNYCFARSQGGRLVLRIEDTDQARSTRASERMILEAFSWLGIEWDEGPDVGGSYGPYRQSERLAIYREHAGQLVERGQAYPCFCSRERLEAMRVEQEKQGRAGYDRHCRALDPAEARARLRSGEEHVVRLKLPVEGVCVMHDLLRGAIQREWALVDDQVLLKSDGFPTYHLANVVDDHLMRISHVIRGEEWINSVPKHLRLYEAFGWEPPVFCHTPLLRNPDRSKLSKRKNPTSINYYRRAGYLPQAVRNYLGLMGWAMPDARDKFSLDEMIKHFRLEDINLGGPIFDLEKLRWLNGRYLREDLSPEGLVSALKAWALDDERLVRIAPLVQPRLEVLGDWGYMTAFFFADQVPLDPARLTLKGKGAEELKAVLQMGLWELDRLESFDAEAIHAAFTVLSEKLEIKLRDLLLPFYVAISGESVSTPLFDSLAILGIDLTRIRIRRAIDALGGLSGRKLKAVEREHQRLFGPRES